MKLTTLLIWGLWPLTICLWVWFLLTAGFAFYETWIKSEAAQKHDRTIQALTEQVIYYPWKQRLGYAIVSSLLLALLEGAVIFG